MQTLQNRLGIALLSLASLTTPACHRPKEIEQNPDTPAVAELKPIGDTKATPAVLSASERMKIRAAESEIKEALVNGLSSYSKGSGWLVTVQVTNELSASSSITWKTDPNSRATANVTHSLVLEVDTLNLRAEVIKDGIPLRSFSAYQGAWRDGGLDTTDDVMRRYLAKDSLKELLVKLRKSESEGRAPVIVLREAWPEWRLIKNDTTAREQFVKLLEVVLLKEEDIQESERETILKAVNSFIGRE